MEKRIKTTMIGSINAIEKAFSEEIEKSPEFKQKFILLRKEILDIGNQQIRLLKRESE
jgi:hypothetical protein